MIEFIKKIFAKWFGKEEVIVLTEEVVEEEVEEVELPTHCKGHTRFRKSCPLCNAIIA